MAKWLLAHKANTDALVAEDGFMVALRYDVQVRTNTFAHRVLLTDGSLSVAEILVFRPKIAHSCYATARKFGELENWSPRQLGPDHGATEARKEAAGDQGQHPSYCSRTILPTSSPECNERPKDAWV
ncbi:uncharacterized protein PGTG_14873 [Puccinia graminis f. sp. tritici CRL 75-36-700-3]|uniref:Uncharacterized protein n=1 Tax=Puccinia graminis f. sp. tritici (strain CRL 75-36-700-3 / race SCCL) TaxID=418459 RepID=E3KXU6_PUCGT|nr:uncharacterized protein PGTG_14873 [Puccinia graminis f. sp. tritici CRL 75-36-700-3]EFP89032.1 hypothetical protein PGTG_14873 [Puccinia graminis f. sp. tritici CRL 75-36-700-3]